MTLPAIFLIDKLGRRTLLVSSLATMSISSIVLGYSINNEMYVVASAGIMAFVVSFAMGLGPLPFVLLGELPKEEVSLLFFHPFLLLLAPRRRFIHLRAD